MKPYVICLMASSVDGRTLPSRWRPKGAGADLFERVHDELAGDAWLVGRVTGQEFAKGKPYPASTKETFPREPWFARRDAKAYGVVLDAHGKIGWGRSDIGGDPIVVVLSETVSDAHLAGLRGEGVSYIFAGKSELDLAAHAGHPQSRTRREAAAAGRRRRSQRSFSARGIVDELNLILCPAVDGAKGAPSVFDSTDAEADHRAPVTAMTLDEQPGPGRRRHVAAVPDPERDPKRWPIGKAWHVTIHDHIVVIGAGAAGLMAARELARAGRRVTLLEARDRCGGRIYPLPAGDFGYPAEGRRRIRPWRGSGHARPVARGGAFGCCRSRARHGQWRTGSSCERDVQAPHQAELQRALQDLKDDLTVAEFLRRHFAGPRVRSLAAFHRADGRRLRRGGSGAGQHAGASRRMDGWRTSYARAHHRRLRRPHRFSHSGVPQPRRCDPAWLQPSPPSKRSDGRALVRCANGDAHGCDAVILTVPLPLLNKIVLPPAERERAAAAAHIGFGNVIKILLRFETRLVARQANGSRRSDVPARRMRGFRSGGRSIPPISPCSRAGSAGPKTESLANLGEHELIEVGLASLAEIFGLDPQQLRSASGRGAGDQLGA